MLKALPSEQTFAANECVSLGLADAVGKNADWKIVVIEGCVWLSFESPSGKYSATPLIDVVLRAGQSYQLPASALQRSVIVSTFEQSCVRFRRSTQLTSGSVV